jgi:3-oxoacyl-[acyl-carrier protein] reductase
VNPFSVPVPARHALVFGGSGAVGGAVVEALVARGVSTTFTFHNGRARAEALAGASRARAVALDIKQPHAVRELVRVMEAEGEAPDVFVHAAAVTRARTLAELADDDWSEMAAVNVTSALVAAQALAPVMAGRGGGDLVFLGGLDRTQSVPAPVGYAATQGALGAMTMALAKELGRVRVRVNMLAIGILDAGLSRDMDARALDDYRRFSALRRTGTAAEVARAVAWLALDNTYITGRVIPVNGGL